MNETNPNSSATAELSSQVAALQRLVSTLLMALIVISGTLTVFLFYQSHTLKKDLENNRPQAVQIIQSFAKNRPVMEKIVQQLTAYGQTHPDYQPILQKYGFTPAPGAAKK